MLEYEDKAFNQFATFGLDLQHIKHPNREVHVRTFHLGAFLVPGRETRKEQAPYCKILFVMVFFFYRLLAIQFIGSVRWWVCDVCASYG